VVETVVMLVGRVQDVRCTVLQCASPLVLAGGTAG
jgi:hypothetical protein